MQIRLAKEEDLEQVIEIEAICFPAAEAAEAATIKERYHAFPQNFLVAEKAGKVVGFINGCTTHEAKLPDVLYEEVSLHEPDGDIQTVFGLDVLPEYQRQGIAEALLKEFILLTKKRGKAGMVLTCKNHLIHYYEKFGFCHQGTSASTHGGASWNDMVLLFS